MNTAEYMRLLVERIIAEQPSYTYGSESLLELIYASYCDCHGYDNDAIMECYHNLCENLSELSYLERELILNCASALCKEYEKNGFFEGIKIGIRLAHELNK